MALTVDTTLLQGGRGEVRAIGAMAAMRHYFGIIPITFDSSYPTGGESLDISSYFRAFKAAFFSSHATYYFTYDGTVLKAFNHSDGLEVTNTTDLSAVAIYMWVLGQE